MIIKIFPSGPYSTNTIFLACPKTLIAAIIDPGKGVVASAIEFAKTQNMNIQKILLTHSHWDHIADVFPLKKQTQAAVYIHEKDSPNLERPGADGLPLFFSIQGVKPDHYLQDKEIITVGNIYLQVLHTPGHTPGGVCYYCKEESVLFSGDTLFKGSCGNVSFPLSDRNKIIESLKKLSLLPDDTKVIPGHGETTSIGQETWLKNPEGFFSW